MAFIDLDNFKVFNDRIGHAAGDTVLVEVARRLAASVRAEDTVCRLGGDEFVVMYEGLGDSAPLHDALVRLQQALQEPIALEGKEYFLAASIGIVTFPRDGGSAQHSRTVAWRNSSWQTRCAREWPTENLNSMTSAR